MALRFSNDSSTPASVIKASSPGNLDVDDLNPQTRLEQLDYHRQPSHTVPGRLLKSHIGRPLPTSERQRPRSTLQEAKTLQ